MRILSLSPSLYVFHVDRIALVFTYRVPLSSKKKMEIGISLRGRGENASFDYMEMKCIFNPSLGHGEHLSRSAFSFDMGFRCFNAQSSSVNVVACGRACVTAIIIFIDKSRNIESCKNRT